MSAHSRLCIASHKGGCGKSMIARQLGVAAALDGVPTLILDTDHEQRTSSTWASWRTQSPAKAPLMVQEAAFDTMQAKLNAARAAKRELIILDTPGRRSRETDVAAGNSNVVLVIVQPSMDDLVTLPDTYSLAGIASRPAFVVLSRVPNVRLFDEARKALEGDYEVAPFFISENQAYRESIGQGLGVLELSGKSKALITAQDEIRNLLVWTRARLRENTKVPPSPSINDVLSFHERERGA